ncbi:MAG: hypothetical protein OSB43_06630 [Nocardioides sp.]|uniref:hypothetical protein n=1 Tax=Nocardioides sp. TaxID=35761 RepID=UPI00238C73FF|nr:hypothetical protein [Nocardioides sp.]MDE0775928.1 hypothetical protein [Nocardioides sp.]
MSAALDALRTSGCGICANPDEVCPFHLYEYCRARNACYCHSFIEWVDLPSFIDSGDCLRCAMCGQRVLAPFRDVPGHEDLTDADLRAVGTFRRGDYFAPVSGAQ